HRLLVGFELFADGRGHGHCRRRYLRRLPRPALERGLLPCTGILGRSARLELVRRPPLAASSLSCVFLLARLPWSFSTRATPSWSRRRAARGDPVSSRAPRHSCLSLPRA